MRYETVFDELAHCTESAPSWCRSRCPPRRPMVSAGRVSLLRAWRREHSAGQRAEAELLAEAPVGPWRAEAGDSCELQRARRAAKRRRPWTV